MGLPPIVLHGAIHETIWGGQHLAIIAGKVLPTEALVGESWETALDSVAHNDPYTGQTLGALTATLGVRLYGTRARDVCGDRFPLLAKFIDAHDWLSVQVHPNDDYAAQHEGGKLGKTEAWRILYAAHDATIIHGFAQPTTRGKVEEAIHATRLEELVHHMPVAAGDVIMNQAGTLHATGAGIVFYEIQEYSDVTYRLYDFGRVGPDGQQRELHVARGLDVVDYTPLPRHTTRSVAMTTPTPSSATLAMLVVCRHFALAEAAITATQTLDRSTDGTSCHIISVIAGQAVLVTDSAKEEIALPLGQTVVIPAESCDYRVTAVGGDETRLLIAWVPQENDPAVSMWQAAQAHGEG